MSGRVLIVAGSDSGGGAGIQADLKTVLALGGFGATAITALTAQNTTGVRDVHGVPAAHVVAQVEAVLDDLDVRAVKTGMLATAAVVHAVAGLADRLPHLVVDPVMVASSGARLLEHGAVEVADQRGQYGPGTGWVVLVDPEGNEFCILRNLAEREAAPGSETSTPGS